MSLATLSNLVALASLVLSIPALTFGDEFDSVRQRLRTYVNEEGIPSVVVAAVRGSDVVWLEAFGWADVEVRVPATPHTPYMLASTSKAITATAVMVAVEKGHLKLDASVNQYLGASSFRSRLGDASKVTVRDVLLHRSGIPNHNEAYFLREEYRPSGIEALIHNYGWTMIPHGEFHYSNLAFSSLADAISHATGETFASFVHQEVLKPLGMKDSIVPEAGMQPRAAAVRYGEKTRLRDFSTSMVPAAEIYSSASDLARFAIFHLKHELPASQKILPDKSIDEMQTCTIPIRFFHYRYGLGWSVGRDNTGRKHVFHGGGFAGCDSYVTLLPEQDVAVVFLSNKNRKWPGLAVSQEIVEGTLAVLVDDEPETLRINYDRSTLSPSDNFFKKVVGQWNGEVIVGDGDVSVSLRIDADGKAHATLGEAMETRIENAEVIANAFFGMTKGGLTREASRLPEQESIMWDLRLVDESLNGVLYVNCPSEGNGYLLPHWVKLARCGKR